MRASAAAADFAVEDYYPVVDIDVQDNLQVNSSDLFLRVHPADSHPRIQHRTSHTVVADFSDWWNSLNWHVPMESVADVDMDDNANNFHHHHPRRCLHAAVSNDGTTCRPDRSA